MRATLVLVERVAVFAMREFELAVGLVVVAVVRLGAVALVVRDGLDVLVAVALVERVAGPVVRADAPLAGVAVPLDGIAVIV